MFFLGVISETILYLCFSILMGSFILYAVPERYRPSIYVPRNVMLLATGGIAILSFTPLAILVLYLYKDIGIWNTLQSVLFTFEVGKAWVITYFIATFLFIFIVWFDIRKRALFAFIGIAFTLVLILALGYASHASSYDPITGFLTHSTHFTAVTVWVGILFVVGWKSTNYANWLSFLKWYTPLSILCLSVTILSGLYLMNFVIDYEFYTNSWMLTYGQTLLLKHILVLPLLAYAFINGIFIKNTLRKQSAFDPRPWTKAEGIIIGFIFAATAALGQQSPPHETDITKDTVSTLFTYFYQGKYTENMILGLEMSLTSVLLLICATTFFVLMIYSFIKKAGPLLTFILGVFLIISSYLTILVSIQ
ncbi:copper resistance D family protein [Sutcliffiella sp. NPDC057660]|uniref:copper resistance D family protein n=1 Tax=Sutcliffiella sp. NPDC057660 TaxID=3346199 RepID=UPI00367FABEB